MNTEDQWFQCSGAVFRIFVRGKCVGEPILEHDQIVLLLVDKEKYVGFNSPPTLTQCLGSTYPPPIEKYDTCFLEVAELWLR